MSTAAGSVDLSGLERRLSGELVVAGDPRWDVARRAFNLLVDQRPAAVAVPSDADDAAAVVRFAAERGLHVAPQRTGHGAAALGDLDGVVLVNTAGLCEIDIDADRRRAWVGAGAVWQDVVPHASELGLLALHGSSPRLGVVGYTLGGGVGWYARRHGLAANSVTAVEVVTADGDRIRADADTEPDLFWAVRGGGGSFGLVTGLELALHPAEAVYAGALLFDCERANEVLRAWHAWTEEVPESTTSVGRLLQMPPLPGLPEELRDRWFAVVELAHLGGEAEGEEVVAPLRDVGPEIDACGPVAPAAVADLHMDPPEPVPALSDGLLLDDLPGGGVDAFVAACDPGSGSSLVSAELRHLGGALARGAPHHGALDRLDADFLCVAVGMAADPPSVEVVRAQLTRMAEAMAPHTTGRALNFAEQPIDPRAAFPEPTARHLQAVKARYDPDERFRANHPIRPDLPPH